MNGKCLYKPFGIRTSLSVPLLITASVNTPDFGFLFPISCKYCTVPNSGVSLKLHQSQAGVMFGNGTASRFLVTIVGQVGMGYGLVLPSQKFSS